MKHTLTLAHSPDADDLVMFWPLVGLTDAEGMPVPGRYESPCIADDGFGFELIPEDVEVLNKRAIETADLDITAISARAYPDCVQHYRITATGGSFGEGYGPKVVARSGGPIGTLSDLAGGSYRVAVPGINTTACLTLRILVGPTSSGSAVEVIEIPFAEIAAAVEAGEVDAGVLIHEAQLTVDASEQLKIIADLGAEWGSSRGIPLPLGLNVIKRDLDERFGEGTVERIAHLLERSVQFAVEHAEASHEFLRMRAASRPEWADPKLVKKYLSMYVSGLTLNMGHRGKNALEVLYAEGHKAGLLAASGGVDVVGL